MIEWTYFPQSTPPTDLARAVVNVFEVKDKDLNSESHIGQSSNQALAKVAGGLKKIGFQVERGKRGVDKITIPVLFGRNGFIEKYFEADAYHLEAGFVIEVEAGRGVTNYQFLKDLFQACMMQNVDYLAIAVRRSYRNSHDYEKVFTFFDTLFKSNRMKLPLKGLLLIGY